MENTLVVCFELGLHETISGQTEPYELVGPDEEELIAEAVSIAMARVKGATEAGVCAWASTLSVDTLPA